MIESFKVGKDVNQGKEKENESKNESGSESG